MTVKDSGGPIDGRHVVELAPNQPGARPYRGGAGIARFRGCDPLDDRRPEDFLASTTEVFTGGGVGLTILPDGRSLRDVLTADPETWFGPEHVRHYGTDPRLLVKLLHTGERLFSHFHPAADFARERFGTLSGKTEAWAILDAPADGYALLGFQEQVDAARLQGWIADQAVDDMLASMRRVPLRSGDTLLVPAGLPHAIGPDITLVELQEPVDLSILLEYAPFGLDEQAAWLGLGLDAALEGIDRSVVDEATVAALRGSEPAEGAGELPLFPEAAERFFRGRRVAVRDELRLEPGYRVIVVTRGEGEIGGTPVRSGTCLLVPFGAGAVQLSGDLDALTAQPPVAAAQ
ncbi:class I mannose-6-phosphate isomerase [Gryllotalpicola ginsengisoli]|uniref:class I mannose-6-phosphate isomerase n=1 Tax=Gryllotalpicola ginsengisoli TaxID=444608 RepID=UPI0003B2EF54|nr:class I mannose-6-phosphate isomerase [Gryllotalpicola ginsengisoli]